MKQQPSTSYLLKKALGLSVSNIWRNKLLSLATIFVTGTIIFIFNIILAVNFIAKDSLNDLNKKIDISVYLKGDISTEELQSLNSELKNIKEIAEIKYISKDEALEQLKTTHPDIGQSLEKYKLGNPLPASLNITTTSPEYHKALIDLLSQDRYKSYFSNIINNEENNKIITSVSNNLLELSKFTHRVIFWLIVIFIVGGSLIILNALQINIFARKKEISIMKLVGAPNWFIKAPFIAESAIYGALATILSFAMLFIISGQIEIEKTNLLHYLNNTNFYLTFLAELLITITLSVISSFIAVHEHLQKKIA